MLKSKQSKTDRGLFMSILESFYILFKSDASEVKKGADEAEKATKKLSDSLSSVGKESALIGQEFARSAQHVLSLFAGLASVRGILGSLRGAVTEVSNIGNVSRELMVNVETLDAWSNAVQRTGGTARGFQSSLQSLANNLNTTSAVALRVLPTLADALSKMNQAQANRYGKSLGLDQSTIYLLQQGRRELEATISKQKELGLVTQQDVDATRKFDNALYDLGRVFSLFERQIALPALPLLTKGFNYLIEHKDLIKGALIAIGIGMAGISTYAVIAGAGVSRLVAAMTVLVGLFATVFEDFKKFKEGAPSVIGYVSDKVKGIRDYAQNFVAGAPERKQAFLDSIQNFRLPQFFGGSSSNSSSIINIDKIEIQTQATDAEGISRSINRSLRDQIQQWTGNVDSGVKI